MFCWQLFLKERLSRSGMIACGLAAVGVIMLSVQTGAIPYASLIMAFHSARMVSSKTHTNQFCNGINS